MRLSLGFLLGLLCVTMGCQSKIERERLEPVELLKREFYEQTGFVKIHAAESLITHGYQAIVEESLVSEAAIATLPYSIGVHRALALAVSDPAQRESHLEAIRRVALDSQSEYQIHAIESLAKLHAYRDEDRKFFEEQIRSGTPSASAFTKWLLSFSQKPDDIERLVAGLPDEDAIARLRCAYALSRTESISDKAKVDLLDRLKAEPLNSPARVYVLSACLRKASLTVEQMTEFRREMIGFLSSEKANEAHEAGLALGALSDASLTPALAANLKAKEADARIGAADGMLCFMRSQKRAMSTLDWTIVVGFLLAMLLIGIFYAMQEQTRDEYLLGGRNMRPWAVGISYFATIFSTVTYLSWPGEIIRNGPMMLGQILGFPLAILVVNYYIIPVFMGLRVTSAYEILELRLGMSVRLLGATLFLLMRLFWMAVIVHTTTVEILIPVAGFDKSIAPILALVICLGTIVYTALGGFKAVVVTDVAQTLILVGATVAVLLTITVRFGGLSWFPTQWESQWQTPVFFYDRSARVTFCGAILAMLTWQVCTAGSDQMAIQRYFATKNTRAARRMFTIALVSNGLVCLCLAALGFSLFAYFRMRPEMLNIHQSIDKDSDQFFQHFVAVAMAPGVCGLVVAGLLSAAMDSLSSGINSSSSVITVDFIERFRKEARDGSAHVARWISWLIGLTIVGFSTLVGFVSGNLLEVAYKVVNLLTAPLFGIFFMALFVRWATPFGTWIGTAAGVTCVVIINYWKEIFGTGGIGFIWGMPFSLVIQIVVGCLASAMPIGSGPRPMFVRESFSTS